VTAIVIEFGNPEATERALNWRKELVERIEKAILSLSNKTPTGEIQIFNTRDFSVYLTFQKVEAISPTTGQIQYRSRRA